MGNADSNESQTNLTPCPPKLITYLINLPLASLVNSNSNKSNPMPNLSQSFILLTYPINLPPAFLVNFNYSPNVLSHYPTLITLFQPNNNP